MFYRLRSFYFGFVLIILHAKIKGKFKSSLTYSIDMGKSLFKWSFYSLDFKFPLVFDWFMKKKCN